MIVSVFNPKIAVFFLAFLPQFVNPTAGSIPQQVMFLGVVYVGLAVFTDGAYALLTGGARRWVSDRATRGALPRYVSGGLYLGLGVNAALAERPS